MSWRARKGPELYLAYETCASLYFWAPVKFLYLVALFPLREVLVLEALFQGATFLLEVPSGYASDRFGRRPTLLVASLCRAASAALLAAAPSFEAVALAQVLLAAGFAFRSGTDVSFHYGTLRTLGREAEFVVREARAHRLALAATAAAALAGGFLGCRSYATVFMVQTGAMLLGVLLAALMVEPTRDAGGMEGGEPLAVAPEGFRAQLRACLALLRSPPLAWASGALVLAKLLDHLPYNFYQPYLELLDGAGTGWTSGLAPSLVAGVHVAGTMALGAVLTRSSVGASRRLGLRTLVLATLAFQLGMIGAMAGFLHGAVLGLVLLREAPNALLQAPWRAAVVPRVPEAQRATFLSVQALLVRLVLAGTLALLTAATGAGAPADWPSLRAVLAAGAGLGAAGWLLLAATSRWAPRPEPA